MAKVKYLALFLLAILVACASPVIAPTATPVPTPLPPSATPVATAAASSTPASPTVAPSATVAPSIAPTLASTPTPESSTRWGPDNFPVDVDPLTGLRVEDSTQLERRPLAIKVSEFPRRVRPQFGLSLADLVFEHYAEAGITRMTAIFLGHSAPKVGSIRSARLIDTVLGEAYQAMLVTSGSSAGTLNRLYHTNFADRIIAEATGYTQCPPLCRAGSATESTDNLFASTDDLWSITTQLGLNGRQSLRGMAFASDPPAGGVPGTTLHIDYQRDYNIVEWRYQPAAALYARWVDTDTAGLLVPHTDALDGGQLTAANVVMLYVNHQPTDLVEDYGSVGHCGYEIQLWGSGPARIFRDGQLYEATWVRFAQPDLIGLVGIDNTLFALRPGNTWFEVIDSDSPTTIDQGVLSTRFKGPSQSDNCPVNQPTPTP